MDEVTERLRECFRTVFEDMSDEQIETAVRAELAEWDSLAALTLITVVEEEFELQLDDETVGDLDSFTALRGAVEQGAAA
jgi:acyl carrier protein